MEHPGKHPALIEVNLFERVQLIFDERELHALKPRRHQHYLRGLLSCGRCGSRLQYTTGRGQHGNEFDYYVCSKRHKGAGCDLPYLPAVVVDERIERAWPYWVRLDALDGEAVGTQLHRLVVGDRDQTDRRLHAQRRLARLDTERLKLVQMAYADAIPLELLKSEQDRVTKERREAERAAAEAQGSTEAVMEIYHQAQALMRRGAEAYRLGGPDVRRLLTRAFLARIEVDIDDEQATLASPWLEIQKAAAHTRRISTRLPG